MPIYYYVGDVNSYMGTTVSGVTFSSTGTMVKGVSGSSVSLASTTKSGNASFIGDNTPLVFINTTTSPNSTNYTLPNQPANGTVVIVRRTDTAGTGTTTLNASQFGNASIRVIGSTVLSSSITIAVNTYRNFFYSHGVWWEF